MLSRCDFDAQSEAAVAPDAISVAAAFASMGDKRVKRRFWPTHIYDYNYKVSEGYYKPQSDYMFSSNFERSRYSPPKHATYAERFASSPWYGNAYGLPYRKEYSALNEPLLKPSEHPFHESPLVQQIKDQGEREIPLHVRASRRRRKFEEEDEQLGIRPPRLPRTFSLDNDRKNRPLPSYKDISEKLRNLDSELVRLAPRRSGFTEENYTLPSGAKVHKYTRTEVSHYDSSRPPIGSRVRKFSFNEDSSDLLPKPRQRISSVGESSNFMRTSRRSSIEDEDDAFGLAPYSGRAARLREMRKLQQSRDITEGVHQLVEKMRSSKLNPEHGYTDRKEKGLRPSEIDPHFIEDEKIKNTFTYNVKRKH